MKKVFIFLVCSSLLACSSSSIKQKVIRVSGEGKIRIKPNLVILTITVSNTQSRMVDAVKKTQETVDSVVNLLHLFSSNENDIKTSCISADKATEYNGNRNVFIGYQATQSIDFVLHNIDKFTELTAKLLETKISSISNFQFGHSQADSILREADLLAYDDALKSANKLCTRSNATLGKLLYLTNTESNSYTNNENGGYYGDAKIRTFAKGYGGNGFKIAPEVLEFKRTIISEYEIKN